MPYTVFTHSKTQKEFINRKKGMFPNPQKDDDVLPCCKVFIDSRQYEHTLLEKSRYFANWFPL